MKDIEAIYPLSKLQESLLPGSDEPAAARIAERQLICRVRGDLNYSDLKQAWQNVIARHAVLRTSFVWRRVARPLQVVHAQLSNVTLDHLDLRQWPHFAERDDLYEALAVEAQRAINPAKAPLLRPVLCRTHDDTHYLVCNYARLMFDERSVLLLLAEILSEYDRLQHADSRNAGPPPLFANYLDWLNQQNESMVRDFWEKSLRDLPAPATLQFGSEPAARADRETKFTRQRLLLEQSEIEALRWFEDKHGLAPEVVSLGACALLLSRYLDREDFTFGIGVSGRPPDLEGAMFMAGPFADFLPLSTHVDHDMSGLAWLRTMQTRLQTLEQHAWYPTSQIREVRDPDRLFETTFLIEDEVDVTSLARNAGLEVDDVQGSRGETSLEVRLVLGSEPRLNALYDARRFEGETIQRFLQHLRNLMRDLIANPTRRVSQLSMIDEAELRRLLSEWNDTEKSYPRDKCIQQLFEEQVEKAPGAIALTFGDIDLSYGELNERANQLARYLTKLGVGPEISVGVCLERSLEMIVAVLAILKAGGAYVPLDPEYPLERLAFILEETQTPVLLTQEHLSERLPVFWGQVVMLDSDLDLWAGETKEDLVNLTTAENLAYITYTSGSTGRPKGVEITHRGVIRLVNATDYATLSPDEVFLQFAPLAFDASTFEIWGSLLNGARLIVMPPRLPSLTELAKTIDHYHVTTLWLTAGLFHLMVDDQLDGLRNLHQLLAGGDVLSVPHVQTVRHRFPGLRLINGYGPTESTTFACCYTVPTNSELHGSVPIGRPITNTRVYLLDHLLRPVPNGVAGELFIGGDGLARSYHHRPELTATRFVPDPFATRPGERLYRTGDLALWRADGNLEFLGRLDNQVKIAGHRIEPGEIEFALSQHSTIKQCVVSVEGIDRSKRLVAYVVSAAEVPPAPGELRAFLAEKLPEFMLPSAFVVLDSLPLTAHGKVDRAALPHLATIATEPEVTFVAPRTDDEGTLAEIWSEVLGLSRVGVNDNFFELGGDSMRCIQVLSKAERRGLRLSLQQLFDHQTIADLAKVVEVNLDHTTAPVVQPFSLVAEIDRDKLPADLEDAYPLAALQLGMLFHSEYSPESAVYHDIFSLHLRASLDERVLREASQLLIARHPILRTSFALSGYSEPLQFVHSKVEIPIEVTDLRHLPKAEQEMALAAWLEGEKLQRFDWRRAPLLRLAAQRRGEQTFQLGVSFHHAILDGWSIATLLTELFRLYFSMLGEDVGQLEPPPAITYRDFIALERAALESEEARNYWSDKLTGSPASSLPRWPSVANLARQDRRTMATVPISAEVSEGLRRLATSASVPLKSVLLAAHLRVLSLLTGQADVLTGVVAYTRAEAADGDRVLGLFLNTLPFRMRLSGGSWIDLARQTFAAEQECLRFRHYPMAHVQKERGGQLFETGFNYTHFHVYRTVRELKAGLLLDEKVFAETELPFWANFDLDASTSDIHLGLTVDTEQFAMDQATSFVEYYANTLAAMVADPQGRYERASLLPPMEQRCLLEGWNDTAVEYKKHEFFHRVFELRTTLNPTTAAVVSREGQLSYEELNRRANQLANYLWHLGVRPETVVGICLDRSIDMLVAVFGVLKAGGAYVPIDPLQPSERREFIIADAHAAVVITRESFRTGVSNARRTVCIDSEWQEIAGCDDSDPQVPLSSRNIAYIIYTSGSTGQPKGTMIEHRSLINLTVNHPVTDRLQTRCPLRVSLNAPLIFDASVQQLVQLAYGHTLFIIPEELRRDAEALLSYLRTEALDVFDCTPSQLKLLVAAGLGDKSELEPRVFLVGGEALDTSTWTRLATLTGIDFYNVYGPTECTVDATSCLVRRELILPSIGRPLANTRAYVLNPHLELVPTGTTGELYIAGDGLARGYRSRPDLTAERFVPNPFAGEPGGRMYATGDLVRYLPDGYLEFTGRIDDQIKLRGFRVEPGEISDALSQHFSVREAFVMAREDVAGVHLLVAYVVAEEDNNSLETELRDFLRAKLPAYMLPASYVFLEALPLTINGKVDRRLLPPPDASRSKGAAEFVEPQDDIERRMARIWEEVLGVAPVGAMDNFFELGGHSLTAVRLMAFVEQQFERKLPLSVLFRCATVRELAEILRQQRQRAADDCLVPLRVNGVGHPLFLVHPTGGHVFCYTDLARCLDAGRPVYGLQARGVEDELAPHTSVEAMAACYRNAVTKIQPEGPYALAGWSLGGAITFEMARQFHSLGQEVTLLALLDTRAPSSGLEMPDELTLLAEFGLMLGVNWRQLNVSTQQLSSIPRDQRLDWLLAQVRSVGVIPAEIDLDDLRRLFNVYRAHVRAGLEYEPTPIDARVTLLKASVVPAGSVGDYTSGWQKLAGRGVDVYEVPGTHYTMLREPYVRTMAERLGASLAATQCVEMTS